MATYQTVTREDRIDVAPYLAKAHESLRSATLLRDAGLHADAASRAHQACIHCARALLTTEKRMPPDVRGVQRMAANHFLQGRDFAPEHLAAVERLAALRSRADDLPAGIVPAGDAADAVSLAAAFVAAAEAWLSAGGFLGAAG